MDELNARRAALELAIREVPAGTTWDQVIRLSDKFAAFIINGTVPLSENVEVK